MDVDKPDANQAIANKREAIFGEHHSRKSGKAKEPRATKKVDATTQIIPFPDTWNDIYNMPVSSLAASDIIE